MFLFISKLLLANFDNEFIGKYRKNIGICLQKLISPKKELIIKLNGFLKIIIKYKEINAS